MLLRKAHSCPNISPNGWNLAKLCAVQTEGTLEENIVGL